MVPDGALHGLPFSALKDPIRRKDLIESFEIITAPSLKAHESLARLRQDKADATNSIAIFADPVFSRTDSRLQNLPSNQSQTPTQFGRGPLDRLVFSSLEVDSILEHHQTGKSLVMTGFNASRENLLRADLSAHNILHIASHGIVSTTSPDGTFIATSRLNSNGENVHGDLHLRDIQGLSLNGALVILSACDTALGERIEGEGLIGLTQSFIAAGARSVIASLWPVRDRTTAEFMNIFYKELLMNNKTESEALRAAQIEIRNNPRWSSPYFWAPFILIGS